MAHYLIGVTFAGIFISIMGTSWLEHPTPAPAVVFGVVTTLAPFLIMQPAFGFGMAASRAANPGQARMRTVMNHIAFGFGIYFFGMLANWLR